jgi:hypothetical protein
MWHRNQCVQIERTNLALADTSDRAVEPVFLKTIEVEVPRDRARPRSDSAERGDIDGWA